MKVRGQLDVIGKRSLMPPEADPVNMDSDNIMNKLKNLGWNTS